MKLVGWQAGCKPILVLSLLLLLFLGTCQGFVTDIHNHLSRHSAPSSQTFRREFSSSVFRSKKFPNHSYSSSTHNNYRQRHHFRSTHTSSQLNAFPRMSLASASAAATTAATATMASLESSQYLVRIIFLRALAFVYFVAFAVAFNQNKALIGDNGITPARYLLQEAKDRAEQKRARREAWIRDRMKREDEIANEHLGENKRYPFRVLVRKFLWQIRKQPFYQRVREVLWDRADLAGRPITSVLWLAKDFKNLNPWLDGISLTGMALAGITMALGAANVPLLMALWVCQRSLMAVGGVFYGYGWEPQLAELGFHAIFMVPLLSLNPIPSSPVPTIVSWTIRWYLFRIMMGAGLIKMKSGDRKWKDLTTMNYFYETQPVPSLLTRAMHFMPEAWHKFEVLTNHFVELVAPFFLLFPFGVLPKVLRVAGLTQIVFQAILISTGNLSFLNWLTMVPAIMCFDDAYVKGLFSSATVTEASRAAATFAPTLTRNVISWSFGALVMWLSIPVIKNLLAKRQRMNGSFDPLRLINTYGAFGVVSEKREEFIIESSTNGADWREYVFKVKPGPLDRRPRWITPYHYRLDWQLWIAAQVRTLERSSWIFRFLVKLLQEDPDVLALLDHDPWKDSSERPKYIRVSMYRYKFRKGFGAPYWDREPVERVYPRQGSFATILSLTDEVKMREPKRPV